MVLQPESVYVQLGNKQDDTTGAISPPIHLSTAYRHNELGQSTGYEYTRTKNPTRSILEEGIAALEHGVAGFACSSGMAAIQLVLSLFKSGDHILLPYDIYGGTYRLLAHAHEHYQLEVSYADFQDLRSIKQMIRPETKAIFLETPTNPLLEEIDLTEVCQIAKANDLIVIVDNTFYTPYLQQPLRLGADIVVHSATKYLAGHNDVLAGLVVAKSKQIAERLADLHNNIGATLGPFDAWLVIRGIKTLPLRIRAQQKNAQHLAAFLADQDHVQEVIYPGKGAMVSFRLQESSWVAPFLKQLKLISFAESLGGVESFITYPATQTHADIPEAERVARGIDGQLLRFSVGIENVNDLIADLTQSFSKMNNSKGGDLE
ncbi:methionine biosynthesis PLP-dependent protein [Amphibacillus sediminis]|uniref:methionine biosynthesis PLP-dependent protein n=1 Tax=Amphibacillus sediminis TaxID=360185 RepID=UPI0008297EDE|nr:methionine biosynthesis PLP-dependent protein [Amphibacillus sediminis]